MKVETGMCVSSPNQMSKDRSRSPPRRQRSPSPRGRHDDRGGRDSGRRYDDRDDRDRARYDDRRDNERARYDDRRNYDRPRYDDRRDERPVHDDRPRLPPPDTSGLHSVKVDNFGYETRPDELRAIFAKFGEIGDVHTPFDRATGRCRGFGFVRFTKKEDAEEACAKMDGFSLNGRELRVVFARHPRPMDERASAAPGRSPPRRRSRSPRRD
jgi:RNA recognition motif-containing protein